MFVPASSEVSVSHLSALAPRPLPSRAYAQAFSLLAILLQEDPSQLVTFKNNGGVQLLAILLRRCPPSHLSVELVTVIQQIVEALKRDHELYIDGIRYLLFDFSVWGSAPWQTHVVVLRLLSDVINQDPLLVKNHVGIRPLLQALVKIYYSELSEYSCKRDESFTEDLVGELQTSVMEMIRTMLDAETSAYRVDVSYLLSVIYMVDDADIILPILQLFYDYMMACRTEFVLSLVATPKTNLFQSLCLCKAHTVFLKCFCNEVEEVRCLAIQCLQCFWTALSPAVRLSTGINEFTADECSGIADFLTDNSVTLGVYQALMDFTLSLKVGERATRLSAAWKRGEGSGGRTTSSRDPEPLRV